MSVPTFTKSGTKATTAAKLDKSIFDVDVKNHDLLKQAYIAYLANGRENLAKTLRRGEVRGGGKKPWKQKGTGRARFGSIRVPIWRGGGITFGPLGKENYSKQLPVSAKRTAVRQALSLKNQAGNLFVIESFECKEGKVSETKKLLDKIGAQKSVLIVVSHKDELVERATRNLQGVKAVHATYLNVRDILDADKVVISEKAVEIVSEWLKKTPNTSQATEGKK